MRIIDRYILRQFAQTFAICFLSLTGLYVVFGAFTNLDSFLKVAEQQGNLLGVVAGYYGYQSLFFFDMTAGMLALISAMFTVTWLQRHNEMTALMAAGVPRVRAAMPVIIAAALIAVLATVNRELIMPRYRSELVRTPSDLTGDAPRKFDPRCDDRTDILIWGKTAYLSERRICEPSFLLPETLNRYGNQLTAESAWYRGPEGDRPGGYLCRGVDQPKNLASLPSLAMGEKRILITPRDADWLKPDECFIVSDVSFELLTEGLEFASTAQLIAGLRNPSLGFGAPVRVEIHSRIVRPLLDVTLLFLGLPLVMTRENRNVFIAIGLCIFVVSFFVVIMMAFQALGTNCMIPAHLAAWAPLLIFVPVAVGMAGSMSK
ncbi:MAG TPA: LptF/LptG family permease [Thermoguttaceae bacterium]|nr:LptF/LptG family permease [Thermoguttaceae bacterium]